MKNKSNGFYKIKNSPEGAAPYQEEVSQNEKVPFSQKLKGFLSNENPGENKLSGIMNILGGIGLMKSGREGDMRDAGVIMNVLKDYQSQTRMLPKGIQESLIYSKMSPEQQSAFKEYSAAKNPYSQSILARIDEDKRQYDNNKQVEGLLLDMITKNANIPATSYAPTNESEEPEMVVGGNQLKNKMKRVKID